MLAGTPVLPVPIPAWRLPIATSPATAAVYVYEKDDAAIPPGVTSGLDKLNRERRIPATMFEVDTVDGTGEVPDQYKPAVEAAKKESIPSLVILSGSKAMRVVKSPKTEDDVVRAVP